jgi:hypothetical protein
MREETCGLDCAHELHGVCSLTGDPATKLRGYFRHYSTTEESEVSTMESEV